MADVRCPLCNGCGRQESPSFSDSTKLITRSCSACKGKGILIREYDHGTVWALSTALREVLARYPSNYILSYMEAGDAVPVSTQATVTDVVKWREILATYGIEE